MRPDLKNQVVVITGASSGIGRETALYMAAYGTSLVLAARNEQALFEVAEAVQERGGRALPVVTDVSDWRQVRNLADKALRVFGRIDTWVNNAAVSEYARFQDMTVDEIDRILQVDLLGQIYGTRAALEHMIMRRAGGIINISSIAGERAIPLQSIYCAAKHGVKGFTEAVRLELEADKIPVSVSLIMPGSINTPFFNHARSKVGGKPSPVPPVYNPSLVAEMIAHCAVYPKDRVIVGAAAKAVEILERYSPSFLDFFMTSSKRGIRSQITQAPENERDALFSPVPENSRSRGDFGEIEKNKDFYTTIFEKNPVLKSAVMSAAVLGAVGVWRSWNSNRAG